MKNITILLITASLLSACATPEQLEQARLEREQQDVETCMNYGFRPKSDGFRNCMLQLNIAREQRNYYNSNYYGGYYGGYPHRYPGASVGYYIGR